MNIWIAPLHGITNYIFRNSLCRHFAGIDFFMTPFFPVQEKSKLNVRGWQDLWPQHNTYCPTTPQLMGNKAHHFVETMNLLHDTYGYNTFNWNLGCPVSQVVHRHRGCGFMPFADGVEEVVRVVTTETPYKFSIKMRLGLHSPEEGLRILEKVEKYPLEYLVIHPRLGEQMYDGVPDLNTFATFCENTSHRMIYSGDLFSVNDYHTLQQRFPKIKDWMLGRGLLRNPFLAEEIKGMEIGDRKSRFMKYYQQWVNTLLTLRKERSTLSNLKELWHYYAHFFNLSESELRWLLRMNDFEQFYDASLEMIKRY